LSGTPARSSPSPVAHGDSAPKGDADFPWTQTPTGRRGVLRSGLLANSPRRGPQRTDAALPAGHNANGGSVDGSRMSVAAILTGDICRDSAFSDAVLEQTRML